MKAKIAYLVGVVFFLLISFFYMLDKWQVLAFENYLPGLGTDLQPQIPLLNATNESEENLPESASLASSLQWEELRKMQKNVQAEQADIQKQLAALAQTEQQILAKDSELEKREKQLAQQKKQLEAQQQRLAQLKIEDEALVDKVVGIDPEQAVNILETMPDQDVVRILLKVDERSRKTNRRSTAPYLLSLLPKQKSGRILSLMLQENEGERAKAWQNQNGQPQPQPTTGTPEPTNTNNANTNEANPEQ